jgi:DNA-binding NtrC family response regulator
MLDQGRRELVFVVDDERTIAESAAMVLRLHGFDARPFSDPLAALEASQIEAPDLLLADVIMPGLNGFELSAGVVKDCPKCKVLLFSGNPGVRDSHAATATERAYDLLIKPVPPADLLNAIRGKLDA